MKKLKIGWLHKSTEFPGNKEEIFANSAKVLENLASPWI